MHPYLDFPAHRTIISHRLINSTQHAMMQYHLYHGNDFFLNWWQWIYEMKKKVD
jgi:hypothetical protein